MKTQTFVPVTISVRPGEKMLLDEAAESLRQTRSEFIRTAVLPVARAVLEPPRAAVEIAGDVKAIP